ncbi:MAG: helix-turn-helix transcriptional regulator [Sediminibacterium sp.]
MTDKVLLKRLGLRIKQLRTEKGLSQLELGDEIDVEKSNVSRMESGKFNTKILTLYKVAKALDLSLPELLDIEK